MPSGWWHEVQSQGAADGDDGLCISVGINWPEIADAIGQFEPWRKHVIDYPLLTRGQVMARYWGEEKARQMPGYDLPVFD